MLNSSRFWKSVALLLLLLFLALGLYHYRQTRQEVKRTTIGDVQLARKPHRGRIAFVANPGGNWELYVMNGDGTELVQLTESSLDERSPAISPDGEQIAYSTSDGALWVMNIRTKSATPVPLPANRYGYPTWLGDGSGIIYTLYKFTPGNEDADFFVYSFKDQKEQPFLAQTGPQDYPAFSAEANALAYISSAATVLAGVGSRITQQLWVVSLKDSKPVQLTVGSESETRPAWSPDGEWIVFSSNRSGNPDLWAINSEGQELTQLTSTPSAETSPAWSPDGESIAYVSTASGRMQLMLLDVKTREGRSLSPFGSETMEVKDPAWR
jgi:Tol biopolymer transport system component